MEEKRTMKPIFAAEEDDSLKVVSMVEWRDNVYVATEKGVYVVKGDKLVRLKLELQQ